MSKKLVAYFSATGVTAQAAELLSEAADADLFEIRPEIPYKKEDLNWQDPKSRSTIECHDASCRPAIAKRLSNMADYDTVYLGFPIWWYKEPNIIDTFLEQYDFSGKTIILFATSGSSDLGNTAEGIRKLVSRNAAVKELGMLNGTNTEESLKKRIAAVK